MRSRLRDGRGRTPRAASRPAASGDVRDALHGGDRRPPRRRRRAHRRGADVSGGDALPADGERGAHGRGETHGAGIGGGHLVLPARRGRDQALRGGPARPFRRGRDAALRGDAEGGAGPRAAAARRRPAQGGARHVHCRDLADDRGRDDSHRLGAHAREPVLAELRHEPSGDAAPYARPRGPAARTRGTHRARTLSASLDRGAGPHARPRDETGDRGGRPRVDRPRLRGVGHHGAGRPAVAHAAAGRELGRGASRTTAGVWRASPRIRVSRT